MATSTAHRRLLQEYRALTNNPPEGILAGPVSEDDLLHWECMIQGPEGTPFEGGMFPAELKFPKDYPLAPPSMKFLGEIWHPNGKLAVLSDTAEDRFLTWECSVSDGPRLYIDPPSAGRRPESLRACVRAVVTDPIRGEDSHLRNEHVGRAE